MVVYRSAITGKFVTKEYAEANPDTTVRQEIKDSDRDSKFLKRVADRVVDAMEERAEHEMKLQK